MSTSFSKRRNFRPTLTLLLSETPQRGARRPVRIHRPRAPNPTEAPQTPPEGPLPCTTAGPRPHRCAGDRKHYRVGGGVVSPAVPPHHRAYGPQFPTHLDPTPERNFRPTLTLLLSETPQRGARRPVRIHRPRAPNPTEAPQTPPEGPLPCTTAGPRPHRCATGALSRRLQPQRRR